MKKIGLLSIVLILAVAVLGAGCYSPAEAKRNLQLSPKVFAESEDLGNAASIIWSQQNVGLWVTGKGKTSAVPDMVLLSLGVETQQKTVAEAQGEAAEVMDGVMRALKTKGVEEKDIQTQQYNIYPVRRWIENVKREELIGYRVTNMVIAKIRKTEEAGSIIDALARAGGDAIRINSINFTVEDPTSYYKEAREEAVKDAMVKAEQIAAIAGIKLGKPVYISEVNAYSPPVMRNFYDKGELVAESSVPTAISPGELEFQISVQLVYAVN